MSLATARAAAQVGLRCFRYSVARSRALCPAADERHQRRCACDNTLDSKKRCSSPHGFDSSHALRAASAFPRAQEAAGRGTAVHGVATKWLRAPTSRPTASRSSAHPAQSRPRLSSGRARGHQGDLQSTSPRRILRQGSARSTRYTARVAGSSTQPSSPSSTSASRALPLVSTKTHGRGRLGRWKLHNRNAGQQGPAPVGDDSVRDQHTARLRRARCRHRKRVAGEGQQIGTLTETPVAIAPPHRAGYRAFVSHPAARPVDDIHRRPRSGCASRDRSRG